MKDFLIDRKYIENKYHKTSEPFNPNNRMAYHGWSAQEDTGLSVEEIKKGLVGVLETYKGYSHEVQKARAIEYVLDNTRIALLFACRLWMKRVKCGSY